MKSDRANNIIIIFFYIFLFASLVNAERLQFYVDGYIPLLSRQQIFINSVSTWYQDYLGRPTSFHPLDTFFYLLSLISPTLAFLQQVVILLPMLISSLSFYKLVGFENVVNIKILKLFGAILYGINAATFMNLGASALMFTYAFIPLILLYLLKVFRSDKKIVSSILLGLSLSAAGIWNIQAPFQMFIIMFPIIIVLLLVTRINLRELVTVTLSLGLAISLYVLLTLPINLFFIRMLFGKASIASMTTQVKGVGYQIILNREWYKFYFDLPLSSMFSVFNYGILKSASYFILAVMLISLLARKWFNLILMMSLIISVGVILMIVNNFSVATFLYANFLPLKGFEEPPKWSYFLSIFQVSLFIGGLNVIFERINFNWISKIAIFILALLLLFPPLKNQYNTKLIYSQIGSNYYLQKSIPPYFEKLGNRFAKERATVGDFRVLWLPEDAYVRFAISRDLNSLIFPTFSKDVNNLIEQSLSQGSRKSFARVAEILNIKYIVVLKDVKQTSDASIYRYQPIVPAYIIGAPKKIISRLSKESQFKLVDNSSHYSLFELK